jgi:hypothetical protein
MTYYQETHTHEAHGQEVVPPHVEPAHSHHEEPLGHSGGYFAGSYPSIAAVLLLLICTVIVVMFLVWAS